MAANQQPMTLNELTQLRSEPDGQPPEELGRVRTFLSPVTYGKSAGRPTAARSPGQIELQAVTGPVAGSQAAGFEVTSGSFVTGLTVASSGVAKLPTKGSTRAAPNELEAYRPDWSGVQYLPGAADPVTPEAAHVLRRRSGKKVRPEYVFGADDRKVYFPSGYPWRCIGRIFVWPVASNASPSWSGTGALISKNAILTCSHMAPWGSVTAGVPWKALFVSGSYDGASVNGSGGSAWVTGLWGYKGHAQGDDMAVMALNASLGTSLGYFGYKTYTDSWQDGPWWTKCGYPGAVANGVRPSRVTSFPIQDDDNDGAGVELEYEADASPGDSGGPVFGWWDNSPYIIGTHSGGEEEAFDTNNVAAGGAALSALIKWARDNWG